MTDYSLNYNPTDIASRGVQHPNPMFDFLTTFVPRRLKTLFTYCEYLYYNCPQIFAALNKFALYPVTAFTYKTENEKLKQQYKTLLEDTLGLKSILVITGIDRHVYGNAFISLYFPFRRSLRCPVCKYTRNIQHTEYKFHFKGLRFELHCPQCNREVDAEVVDKNIRLNNEINVIRWDPKQIDIQGNPITGESQYFYTIPDSLDQRIREGDKFLINTMPMPFLKSVAEKKLFKFAPGKLYHMKAEAPAGVDIQWGFPALTSTIKQFFYTSVLRKANEAIALEYITPFRVMHPMAASANADPTVTISLANWVNELKMNLRAWRRDPLHIMFSPIPVGVTNVGGQGRALMVTGEIVESENAIIAALGIPREFIYGGLSATGSGVTLRMIENQLLNFSSELVDEAQWIADSCGKYLGWGTVKLGLEDPKLVDDVQQKMIFMQANAMSGGQLFAPSTLATIFGRDISDEREQRKQDQIEEVKFQAELATATSQVQNTLADRARAATTAGQPQQYDQQQIIGQADAIVQQLMQMDPGTRRSQVHSLEAEDYVMYSVVVKRLEEAQKQQMVEMRQQQMGGPSGGGGGGAPGGSSGGAGGM
jgi:hypothetical protein